MGILPSRAPLGPFERIGRLRAFFRYFAITRYYTKHRLYLLVLANLVAGVIEGVGILLFIPFLAELNMPAAADNRVAAITNEAFLRVGVEPSVSSLLLALVAIFVIKGFVVYLVAVYRTYLINQVNMDVREELIDSYARLDYRYAQNKSAGFFGNLLVSEAHRAGLAMSYFCAALSALTTTLLLFTTATLLSAGLSVFAAVSALLFIALFRVTFVRAKVHSDHLSALSSRLNEFSIEALHSFKYLKATERIPVLQNQLKKTAQESQHVQNQLGRLDALHAGAREPVLVLFIALTFYYFVVVRGMGMAVILAAVLLFYRCMVELFHFRGHWQGVANCAGGLETVYLQSKEFEKHLELSGDHRPASIQHQLSFNDVTYAYDRSEVLAGVTLTVPKNGTVAIVGASGAGKSTLVDLMTGVLRPASGTVEVDGRELHELDLADWRGRIGYVAQDTVAFSTTLANNISMAWEENGDPARLEAVRTAARQSSCDEFIEEMPEGYDTTVGERGVRLSGGQRQRLAIARELYRKPEFLILDEATSSLDSLSEKLIQESIERLKGTMTIVVISHRLSTIKNADRIYVLDDGRVVEEGSFTALFDAKDSMFRLMCERQRLT